MGTNWFMPAFVNRRFGESGNKLEDGTMVCDFDLKKSRKSCRIRVLGRIGADVVMANNRMGKLCQWPGQSELEVYPFDFMGMLMDGAGRFPGNGRNPAA